MPPLRARRLSLPDGSALASAPQALLGGLAYGLEKEDALAPAAAGVAARRLLAAPPKMDGWFSEAPATQGVCGGVRWRQHGPWLFGALDLDEAALGGDLAQVAEQAYKDIFATLTQAGCPHLLRVWNYLPDINADGGGIERYRQFNIGRQQAFLDARRDAFEGSPAACALGTLGPGTFSVRFLAGRVRPVAVENPRQVPAYRYPDAFGPRSPTFSRAALFDAGAGEIALLISGTASIVGHASLHAGDVRAQTLETLANLKAVMASAQSRCQAHFTLPDLSCTVYVRHAADAALIQQILESAVGPDSPAARTAIYLQADICRSDLLVEIEAHAFSPGVLCP